MAEQQNELLQLPVIPLPGVVAFPKIPIQFEINDDASLAAADAAGGTDSFVFLVAPAKPVIGTPKLSDFQKIGTIAKIKQAIKDKEGTMHILCDGYERAELKHLRRFADYYTAEVSGKKTTGSDLGGIVGEAMLREAKSALTHMMECIPTLSPDLKKEVMLLNDPGTFADFVAAHILVRFEDKQIILSLYDPMERLQRLLTLMEEETELLLCEMAIHRTVREHLAQNQKEYYLREQIRVIEDELGEGDGEIDEYTQRIRAAKLPPEVEKKLLKENERMSKTPFGSSEASVLRGYLDVCLDLPWNKKTKDRIDLAAAEKILEADHDGLRKVKDRILEYLAVKKLNPELRNQILCLVGPPGVGKTSIARSIAHAMNRKYVRVSLGGVRDEADIRGQRKTYLRAMPGRIINALSQAGVSNPLILLDEIDKLTRDAHGDPSSALLEVLDGEQNKAFRDHFVELPFDLSDCVFIATANTLDTVPRPLIDRMEIIELTTYTEHEKLAIAEHHLVEKQRKRHGLTKRMLKLPEETLTSIIEDYTREAGVRNLERAIADICRKAARKIASGEQKCVNVLPEDLPEYLGPRKLIKETVGDRDLVGVVNGLAWTEAGGELLRVEAVSMPGSGHIECTGNLGTVMKESAQIALSCLRSDSQSLSLPDNFSKDKDIHIHFPEGAVPKDGPSAGIAITTAMLSALTGKKVRKDVAMTGEVTLRGRVLPIGGLKEKTMAALRNGIETVIIPRENEKDLEEIDQTVRRKLRFVPVSRVEEVFSEALVSEGKKTAAQPEEMPLLAVQSCTARPDLRV